MAFEVFHFPYNRADHPSSWDLAFSIHEDMDVIQALCLNHLVSDLRFQLTIYHLYYNIWTKTTIWTKGWEAFPQA